MKRFAVLVTLLAVLMSLSATPVLADHAPPNDTWDGRVVVGSLPYAEQVDTTHATTDALDVEINAGCAPATDASVWYELTLASDLFVMVDVQDADYTAGVVVAVGEPGSFELIQCGPQLIAFEAIAGETYTILVFDDQLDGGGNGGLLTITADEAPPPPEVTVEIGAEGTLNPQTDVGTIGVTVTCSEAVFVELSVSASQAIGRHNVIGGGGAALECGPEPTDVLIEIFGFTSPFNPGTVTVQVDAFACTFVCGFSSAQADVRLRPAPGQPGEPPAPPDPGEPPANDEPDGAFAIALDDTVMQDTTTATASEADPSDCAVEPVPPSGATVWYAFTAPADGFYMATTEGSDYDTVAFVLAPDGSVAGCDDDVILGTGSHSEAIFAGVAGTTYLVMVGSYEFGPGGMLALTITTSEVGPPPPPPPPDAEPPANDERSAPASLGVGDSLGPIDTRGATSGADDPQPSCAPASRTVWFSTTTESAGWVALSTAGSDYDTVIVVLADGEEIACNDDAGFGVQSRAVFFAEPGITYEVMVGSFADSPGGSLVISAEPSDAPLSVELAVDSVALDPRSGIITVTGTVSCSAEAQVDVFAGAQQQNGRFGVFGEGGTFLESCSTEATAFSLQIVGNEAFRPGQTFVFVDAFAFTDGEFAVASFADELHLSGGRPGR